MSDKIKILDAVLDGLMTRYRERVPDVQAIIDKMIEKGIIDSLNDIQNDHIAFRTMGVENLGIASLEKIFLHLGYEKRDFYRFPVKKLNAYWYAPPRPEYPRIFISQLMVDELSAETAAIIRSYTSEVTQDPVDLLNLDNAEQVDDFLHKSLWRTPTWQDYKTLAEKSEYASWVIYNRYYLNHFTISVHTLPDGFNTIAQFNAFLEDSGFQLNDSGGKIKTSEDGLLIQSSTVAEMIDAEFASSNETPVVKKISGSYVEFAERRLLQADGKNSARREGFEASNADKIFESTYKKQTGRRN
ncbi:MAG: DUF1338 domain-containing protein [Deferribacteres bacterium]|nr:DUF1338 domain-containing protein [candidate division KSB1 bacterium]MCB9501721.1 DUF1338 domain-containing protein [Deferribacteres bacterium]